MSLISRLSDRFFGERKNATLNLFREIYGGRESVAGVSVNAGRALEVATVLRCVGVIANGVAQVPWRLHQEVDGQKEIARDHPLNRIISRKPSLRQSSFAFRETLMFHVLLMGNAYVWIGKVGSQREVRRLQILDPHRVTVKNDDDVITYEVRGDDARVEVFGEDQIWHLRGPSWNGWHGLDAVKLARDAIGLSIATENAHAEFHRNGAKSSGVFSVDDELSAERFKHLSAWLDMHAGGGPRSNKPLILDRGASYTPLTMTGVDSQHLETRKHQIEEICRHFGVMPIMVGHADNTATYASAEQMFLAHVVHTLSPWYERLEQSADLALLSDEEIDAGYYTKFTPNGLMRGAAADRAEYYAKALGAGGHGTAWMLRNEVRALEEMNAVDGWDDPVEINEPEPEPDDSLFDDEGGDDGTD